MTRNVCEHADRLPKLVVCRPWRNPEREAGNRRGRGKQALDAPRKGVEPKPEQPKLGQGKAEQGKAGQVRLGETKLGRGKLETLQFEGGVLNQTQKVVPATKLVTKLIPTASKGDSHDFL